MTTKPQLRGHPSGTMLILGDSGDLAADLYAAIQAAGGRDRVPDSRDELKARLDEAREGHGLRAEAGYSGPFTHVLWTSEREELRPGVSMLYWLMLVQTNIGDAVYWQTAVGTPGDMELLPSCARREEHDKLLDTLRYIAGKKD